MPNARQSIDEGAACPHSEFRPMEPVRNRLIQGDNLAVMHQQAPRFRLIYADPPFATERHFGTSDGTEIYNDHWQGGRKGYIGWLAPRLEAMHHLLLPGGSLVVHLDHHVVHAVKMLLDGIFGSIGFRDEIIWKKSDNRGRRVHARQFGRVTESLLWYTRGEGWVFHQPWKERATQLGPGGRLPPGVTRDEDGRYFKTAPRGDYTDESLARLEREGRLHRTRAGTVRVKYYLEHRGDALFERVPVDNLWTDIPDKMHIPRAERVDFPTQKPEALLQRIVEAMSDPGELVGDFFCGSGTTLAVAERLGRDWLGVDIHPHAIAVTEERLRRTDVRRFDTIRLR